MKGTPLRYLTIIGLLTVVLLQFVWLYHSFSIFNEQIKEKGSPLLRQALVENLEVIENRCDEDDEVDITINISNELFPQAKSVFAGIPPALFYEALEPYNVFLDLSELDSIYRVLLNEVNIHTSVVMQLVNERDSILESTKPMWSSTWNTIAIDPQIIRMDSTLQVRAYIISPLSAGAQKLSLLLIATGIMMLFVGYCITYQIRIIIRQSRIAQARRDFSHALIHDMKTPLTSIMMGTRILRSGKLDTQPEKKNKYFDILEDEAQHLLDITNNVLNIAKLEQRNLAIDPHTLQLRPMLEYLSTKSSARAAKPVEFIFNLGAETVYADEEYLKEALNNLIENAIKYSKESVIIRISSEDTEDYTILRIWDNGLGISQKAQLRIFEKFERGDATVREHKKKATGFGLGLHYVQLILQAHGGWVDIESIEDEYSQFTLCFPKGNGEK